MIEPDSEDDDSVGDIDVNYDDINQDIENDPADSDRLSVASGLSKDQSRLSIDIPPGWYLNHKYLLA